MKIKDYTKEELELMSYDEVAKIILEQTKKKMKINDLFKKVCEVLELSDDVFTSQIADFFELLTTDKKFIMLSDGYWDLRVRHSEKMIIEDDEEDYEEKEVEEEQEETEEEEEDDVYYDEDNDDDTEDDDLKDLVVMDDEEEL